MARSLSKAAHESIIVAFVKLMAKHAIDEITTDAIAQEAGASKSTIYKHWPDKENLLIDVVARLVASQPVADSGNFRTDVVHLLRNIFLKGQRGAFGKAWPKIWSYSITHPTFCTAVHEQIMEKSPKHALVSVLRAAVAAGELRSNVDPEFALDLLVGPLMHRRFLHGTVPAKMPEEVVDAVWPALK